FAMHAPRGDPRRRAEDAARLRGMSRVRRMVGPPSSVSRMRPRGLLRPVAQQARHETLPQNPPSDHAELRAGGGVGMLLYTPTPVDARGAAALTDAAPTNATNASRTPTIAEGLP